MEEDVNNQGNRVFAPPLKHISQYTRKHDLYLLRMKKEELFVYTQKRADSVNSQSALFFREKERQVSALFFLY